MQSQAKGPTHLEVGGVSVPKIGYGTFRLTGEPCERGVATAIEVGYRHIDTAQVYGNETEVGRGIRAAGVARRDLFVTTKLKGDDLRPARLPQALAKCLERLGTDYVDLLLIHWPNPEVPVGETLGAMEAQSRAGRARLLGVSNFPVALVRQAAATGIPIVCNQVEYHPFLSQRPVLDELRKHRMMLTAYCPIAKGTVAEDPTIRRIAAKHGRSETQVTLRWLIDQPNVAAVPKSATPARIRANFQVFDFALDADDRRAIDGVACGRRLVNPAWSPVWDAA